MKMEVQEISCGYDGSPVLTELSFAVHTGETVSILGPNGVGKTTLFKALLGFIKLDQGAICLDGQSVAGWSRSRLAKLIGYVPQSHTPPFPFTVLEVVMMGRTAHLGLFSSPSKADARQAAQVLEQLGISYLEQRNYTEISGGERQMVLIARAMTQEPQFLIMDEPTAHLDYGNQIRVLQQVNALSSQGLGVIMTTHNPDHAFRCPGQAVLLQRDRPAVSGPTERIVTEDNLRSAYGVEVRIVSLELGMGNMVQTCVPLMEHVTRR
jgi:iron complex transport system ATP-binding protein